MCLHLRCDGTGTSFRLPCFLSFLLLESNLPGLKFSPGHRSARVHLCGIKRNASSSMGCGSCTGIARRPASCPALLICGHSFPPRDKTCAELALFRCGHVPVCLASAM